MFWNGIITLKTEADGGDLNMRVFVALAIIITAAVGLGVGIVVLAPRISRALDRADEETGDRDA